MAGTGYTTSAQARKFNLAYDAAYAETRQRNLTTTTALLWVIRAGLLNTRSMASTQADHAHDGMVTGSLVAIGDLLSERGAI